MGELIQFRLGGPAPVAFLSMLVIFGASLWVFATLVRRETRHRRQTALNQWARSKELRVATTDDAAAMAALSPLIPFRPRIRTLIRGERTSIALVETAGGGMGASTAPPRTWHLLVRELETRWPTTGLRPTAHSLSIVDLFSLSSFPSLMPTARFVTFGSDATAARALAQSPAPGLLPADVGLLVQERFVILDFSSRPFDEIEFDRLLDLVRQLEERLSGALAEVK